MAAKGDANNNDNNNDNFNYNINSNDMVMRIVMLMIIQPGFYHCELELRISIEYSFYRSTRRCTPF
jgi:hypothetical protein